MKKYFATVSDYGTQSRNKLDEAVKDFVKTKDCRLLHGDLAKATFIKDIEFGVHSLNNAYPRCKKLECSTWGGYKNDQVLLGVTSVFTITIFAVKSEVL